MAQIPALKRISKEDFPKQYQDLIGQLADPINLTFEAILAALVTSLNFANLAWQYKQFTNVVVDAKGNPTTGLSLTIMTTGTPLGTLVLQATDNTVPGTPVTAAPFITYTLNAGTLTVNNITGLVAGHNYTLNVAIVA